MDYVNQASELSESLGDSLMIVKSGRLKSLLYRRFDKIDSSMVIAGKILPISERHGFDVETRKILNGMALVYSSKALYDKALTSFFRILELSGPEENTREIAAVFNNIGLVYFKLDELDKALYYFNRSMAVKEKIKDMFDYETTLMNIGLCYAYKKQYTLAQEFTDKVFKWCDGTCSSDFIGKATFNRGLIAYGLNDMAGAEKHFLRSYELVKGNDQRFEMDNLVYLLRIYITTKNINAANNMIKEAGAILSGDTYYTQGVLELYGQLAKFYQQRGDIHQVAHYQAKYIDLRDGVYNEQLTTNLMKVEAEYLERENKAKIEAQAKILELSDEIIVRQRALNIGVCVLAILSIAIVIILTQNVKQKRLANFLLEQKVKERTMELETHHIHLLKSLDERDQQMKRVSAEIKSSMATIKGLCNLSVQDVSVFNAGQYIEKIERASDDLQSGICRALGISENGNSLSTVRNISPVSPPSLRHPHA
jgi:tetratricopeptide (TPR) repeat protein